MPPSPGPMSFSDPLPPLPTASSASGGFAAFLPAMVIRRFGVPGIPPAEPLAHQGPGTVLFADISGFTALAERLAEKGAEGTEELTALLNGYFGRLIQVIEAHGGDVVKFAGDALLAVWWAGGDTLAETALRTARCGQRIQASMGAFADEARIRLSLGIGVGAGDLTVLYVGLPGVQWECVPTGEPIHQMARALAQAARGEVLLSAETWDLVQASCTGSPRGDGCVRLDTVRAFVFAGMARPTQDVPGIDALLPFVQPSIRDRVFAGQADWLSELRRVTVLFVHLGQADPAARDGLAHTQAAFAALYAALAQHEGTLNKLTEDDKGLVALAALGLPPLAHPDDPLRGVRAAMAVHEGLTALGYRCSIGVTTGRVFCGVVGGPTRREYTVMGDPVNLAARLMQHADGRVVCDTSTRDSVADAVLFDDLPPVHLKGKAQAVPVCMPTGFQESPKVPVGHLVGREMERAQLVRAVADLRKGQSTLVLLEGATGVGKTRLVLEIHEMAAAAGIRVLTGAADSLEAATPYFPWRDVVNTLLGLDTVDPADTDARRDAVLRRAQGDHVLGRLAPLLRDLVNVDLPDTDLTAAMSGEVRAYNVQDLVVHLLGFAVLASPLVLILEDAHWFDSASWALLRRVRDAVSPLLLVVSHRPLPDPIPVEVPRLREGPSSRRILVHPLTLAQTAALLEMRLGTPPSEDLVRQVHARSEGNPFFTEVLGLAIQESGQAEVRDGRLHLTATGEALRLPDTIQGTILARIDRLDPHQQLMVKVASVIGRTFAYPLLRAIYPVEADRPDLPQRLQELERLELTVRELPEPDLVYMYRHETTREVAYGLLLYAQRRKLHRAVAEALEEAAPRDRAPLYGRLAWHWGMAEDAEKHLFYLEKAGEQAVLEGAYREAVHAFRDALAQSTTVDPHRRAHWERLLGEAWLGLGNLPESRAALERAAALLGFPVPRNTAGLVASLGRGLIRQIAHRIRPPRPPDPARAAVLREAALAYLRVLETYFFLATTPETLNAALAALNIAEAAGPAPELARSYALFGWIVSMVPLFSVSDLYLRLAADLVERPEGKAALQPVRFFTGFCRVAAGRWAEGHKALDEAVHLAERIGDKRRWIEAVCGWSTLVHYEGQYLRRVRMGSDVLYTSARRHGDFQAEAWGLMDQVESLLALGDQARSMDLLDALVPFLEEAIGRSEQIWGHGLRSTGLLRAGRLDEAREAARRAVAASRTTDPVAVYCFEGYASAADTLTALWERASLAAPRSPVAPPEDAGSTRGAVPADTATLRREAEAALAALRKYAGVFPIARPRALLLQGLARHLTGRPGAALADWRRALAEAERLRMPYDEGRAHLEIGRHLPPGTPERAEALARAEATFDRLSAAWDLARVRGLER